MSPVILIVKCIFALRWNRDPFLVTPMTAAPAKRLSADWRRGRNVARRKSNLLVADWNTDFRDWKRSWSISARMRDNQGTKKLGKKSTIAWLIASLMSAAQ